MKTIFLIPGLGENCGYIRYRKLIERLEKKGYRVNRVDPNWYRPLSSCHFKVPKNAILIGFSFGAVITYRIAKDFPCKKAILCSLSPLHKFSFSDLFLDYWKRMPKEQARELAKDIKNIKINLEALKTPHILLAGEKEKLPADILVPRTGHFMTDQYINAIEKLL